MTGILISIGLVTALAGLVQVQGRPWLGNYGNSAIEIGGSPLDIYFAGLGGLVHIPISTGAYNYNSVPFLSGGRPLA